MLAHSFADVNGRAASAGDTVYEARRAVFIHLSMPELIHKSYREDCFHKRIAVVPACASNSLVTNLHFYTVIYW